MSVGSGPGLANPVHWLAFGFGTGRMPWAPGTWGTLAAVPFYWALQGLPLWGYTAFLVVAALVGVVLCGRAAADLGVDDHPGIVWDEMCGYWLTMLAAPSGLAWMVLGFALFRVYDIAKPWPISWLDRNVHAGIGIMADDLLAGLFAAASLQLLCWLV